MAKLISVLKTGPQGPQGATGAQGPQGAQGAGASSGTLYFPMLNADQTLDSAQASNMSIELTGALTANRLLNLPPPAGAVDTTQRTILNSCTGAKVWVGTGVGQRVGLDPGQRAVVEVTALGTREIISKGLDPRDFGCPWDGVRDDLPGFQALLLSLPANNLAATVIDLPNGRGYFSDDLHIDRCVVMRGKGGNTNRNMKDVGDTNNVAFSGLYSTVLRFAPLKGITTHGYLTSPDGGSATYCRFEDFDVISTRPIISSGGGFGASNYCIDPNYDSRVASTFYEKGRCVLRAGTTKTGTGVYDEGATRGGVRVMFRASVGGTTAAGGDPAAFASAGVADIGTTIVDGGVTWRVESVPKDYEHSRAYAVGEMVLIPGDNSGMYECVAPGTSLAAGANIYSDNGIGMRCPDSMANPLPFEVFLDNPAAPAGLKWKTHTPGAFTIMTTSSWVDRVGIIGFMGAGIFATSDCGDRLGAGAVIHVDCNWFHSRDYNVWHCGVGARWRGTDTNGCLNSNANYLFIGAGRTNVDAAAYLNIPAGKWGNAGNALLDRALAGVTHVNLYLQFSDAPAWRNDNFSGGGFASRMDRLLGETVYDTILRGPTCFATAVYPLGPSENGGVVIDANWGRGISERDITGYGNKRLSAGICAQWGVGGMHWFKSDLDEFGSSQFAWAYQETGAVDIGSAGTGWYSLGYGPFYKRIGFGLSGVKAAEGHCFPRLYRGFFAGPESSGAWYQGLDSADKESIFVRHGLRSVGDRFDRKTSVVGTWSEDIVSVAGYEGSKNFATFAGNSVLVSESPTSAFYIASVAIYADHIKTASGKIVRATAVTGDGLHAASEPAWDTFLVTPGDSHTFNHGSGTVTYRYVGNVPTYVRGRFIEDPVRALCPQSLTKWQDTAATDAATAVPNTDVQAQRFRGTTANNSANQVIHTISTSNFLAADVPASTAHVIVVDVAIAGGGPGGRATMKLSGSFYVDDAETITRLGTDDGPDLKASGSLGSTTANLNIVGNSIQVRLSPSHNSAAVWSGAVQMTRALGVTT